MVNFGPLTAEIALPVWAPLQISTASRLGSVTARHSSSARQPNFAALNRGRHLYSAGRPSRLALAHILVVIIMTEQRDNLLSNGTALRRVQQKAECRTPDSPRHVVTLCCHGDAARLRSRQCCCDAHASDTNLYA